MNVTQESNVITETTWKNQTRNLTALSHLLLQDLQEVETLFCFDLKDSINLSAEIRGFEKTLIKTALLHTGGSQRRSAALLGISPATLNHKMKIYRITFGRPGKPLP